MQAHRSGSLLQLGSATDGTAAVENPACSLIHNVVFLVAMQPHLHILVCGEHLRQIVQIAGAAAQAEAKVDDSPAADGWHEHLRTVHVIVCWRNQVV